MAARRAAAASNNPGARRLLRSIGVGSLDPRRFLHGATCAARALVSLPLVMCDATQCGQPSALYAGAMAPASCKLHVELPDVQCAGQGVSASQD